jgi:hypothetical protein
MPRPTLLAVALLGAALNGAQAQSIRTLAASRQPTDEQHLTVKVEFGVGTFQLKRDQGGALYRTSLVYDEEIFEPVQRYDAESWFLELGITSGNRDISYRRLKNPPQRLDVALSPRVPVTLELSLGAAVSEIDLGGLSLSRATIETGAGKSVVEFSRPTVSPCTQIEIAVAAAQFTAEKLGNSNCEEIRFKGGAGELTMDFTGEWQRRGETKAVIGVGLGALTLRFPSHLGVALTMSRFLASFDESGFRKRGDTYFSDGYDSAEAKLALDVEAALGDIKVVWVPR